MRIRFFFLILYGAVSSTMAQDSLPENTVTDSKVQKEQTLDIIDDSLIQTVLIAPFNAPRSFPIIPLNGGKIRLEFDDLRDDYQEYLYQVVHCDKDWQPYDIEETEYYRSNKSDRIENYSFSEDTKVEFTHYILDLPKPNEAFLKSGNYLLKVFNGDTGWRMLMARFVVIDNKVAVSGNVVRTDDGQYSDYLQQIKFQVHDSRNEIKDVSKVFARIHKNKSWVISCDNLRPSFVMDDVITFDRTEHCYFNGGNEFRQFNMIDYKQITNNIVRVNHLGNGPSKLWLDDDKPRSFLRYATAVDRNGIRQYTGDFKTFEPTQLDYAKVHFSLKTDDAMLGYELYVFGEMCQNRMEEKCKMTFNPNNGKYETTLLLKQGLYDYQYVVKSPYQDLPDEGLIEGSHAETENDYVLLIYYRSPFSGYDELIGMEQINSRVKNETLYKNN